ncbi:hypothetical protein INT47_008211 [Mucor saturninus]|uniref:Uncharacterized protein n=1 Tax=Mucor saturninus TaxID=64648 RepID=A0A8H7V6X6_9FUNG|nr:hypothetical protein INT47_008211 [Mucor saturninus]
MTAVKLAKRASHIDNVSITFKKKDLCHSGNRSKTNVANMTNYFKLFNAFRVQISFAKQLSSIGWASSCLLFNAETIAPCLNETPLTPLLALVHCLIEQESSLMNFAQPNDPTLISLYTKMKKI